MKTGIELIAAERERQIKQEGWSIAHDGLHHKEGELTQAALCYSEVGLAQLTGRWKSSGMTHSPDWPWEDHWYKPAPIAERNLVKAGALIAAEIDRLTGLGKLSAHVFEVFEGDDKNDGLAWCKHCNTTRNEIKGMHVE